VLNSNYGQSLKFKKSRSKMELERQFYLDFPFNTEFDHLPVRYVYS